MKKIKLLLALVPLFALCSCAEEERVKTSVNKEELKVGQLLRIFDYGELIDEYTLMPTEQVGVEYVYTVNNLGYTKMIYTINFYNTTKVITVNLSNDIYGIRKDAVNTYVSKGLSYALYADATK